MACSHYPKRHSIKHILMKTLFPCPILSKINFKFEIFLSLVSKLEGKFITFSEQDAEKLLFFAKFCRQNFH